MLIRLCTELDVEVLERHSPTGSNRYHQQRFSRQQAGSSSFLVAYESEVPVGHAEVRWDGCAAANVREKFPDCPEINALEVFPADHRGRGIGSEVIAEAERRALGRGYRWIGLGVEEKNTAAARLYRRLGYSGTTRYLDTWRYIDRAGVEQVRTDSCTFLVKALR